MVCNDDSQLKIFCRPVGYSGLINLLDTVQGDLC